MKDELSGKIDWEKVNNLVPAIVQDGFSGRVLMMGYMNPEALEQTLQTGYVVFWSRSRAKLWKKGEESGNVLKFRQARVDCDGDSLLVVADPEGPTCHLGLKSCFGNKSDFDLVFLEDLTELIGKRKHVDSKDSYTARLFKEGLSKMSQKLGEEAVETVVAALSEPVEDFDEEVADLLYHLLVLLDAKNTHLSHAIKVSKSRNSP